MKFCNLSEKDLCYYTLKPKLYLKFILKGSKTIKIMKGSNNRMGLTQIKAIFSVYKQT